MLQVVAHLLRFWEPPLGLFVVTFFLQAAGMAFQDSHSNTFVASINGAHRWLGFIHAMYALGGLVSPFVATAIASRAKNHWQLFYLFLVGIGLVNISAVLVMFRDSLKVRAQSTPEEGVSASRSKSATKDIVDTLKSPPVYLLSLFYFFMLG